MRVFIVGVDVVVRVARSVEVVGMDSAVVNVTNWTKSIFRVFDMVTSLICSLRATEKVVVLLFSNALCFEKYFSDPSTAI